MYTRVMLVYTCTHIVKYTSYHLLCQLSFVALKMEHQLSDGVWVEEIESEALEMFKANQHGHEDGYARFMPSGQVVFV